MNISLPFFVRNSDKIIADFIYNYAKKNYDGEFDSIYCFNGAPSGELYIALNLLPELISKNNSKKPLLIVNKKFKYNLCRLFRPEYPVLLCGKSSELYFYNSRELKIKDCSLYVIFSIKHYLEQDILINKENEHYYQYILKNLGITFPEDFVFPKISENIKEKIRNYVKSNGLEKFVILSPEANTCDDGCVEWGDLCRDLSAKGYKIVLNIQDLTKQIAGTIPAFLSYEEFLELSRYACAAIGLRSGFMEILSVNKELPLYVVYSGFPRRGVLKEMSASVALSGFTIKKLPGVNKDKIYEYDINRQDLYFDEILKTL